MDSVILISCSDKKKEGGQPYQESLDPVPWLKNQKLRQELYRTRTKVLEFIKDNKLIDVEKKQGNRGTDPRNSNLVAGPDFGGSENGSYLPVCIRYNGRFFRTIRENSSEEDLSKRWKSSRKPHKFLILSGLYGFVSPFDLIQEYTCHFADRIIESDKSLQLIWRKLLTDILLEQFGSDEGCLIDLLSEEAYQNVFDWSRIYRKERIKCFHRAYKLKTGPETLINSAQFLKREFMESDKEEPPLFQDKYISKDYFDDPNEKILFESKVKTTNKEVAREGIQEVYPELKKSYGQAWDSLSIEIRNLIANSEYSYIKNRDLSDYDFTSSSICLSKAVEIWLEKKIIRPMIEIPMLRSLLVDKNNKPVTPEKATLGNIVHFLSKIVRKYEEDIWLRKDLKKIFPIIQANYIYELNRDIIQISNKFRNDWAHRKPMPKEIIDKFRTSAPGYFNNWMSKWKK